MKNRLDSVRDNISQLSDENLVMLITKQAGEYEPDALKIAQDELRKRNIDIDKYSSVSVDSNTNNSAESFDLNTNGFGSPAEELVAFSEVVRKAFYSLIEKTLRRSHPEDEEFLGNYREFFGRLLETQPSIHKNIVIKAESEKMYTDGSPVYFWHIVGLDLNTGLKVGLDKCNWKDWLGLQVSLQDLENTGHEAFVAHCLYKMTEKGFTEEDLP